MKEDKHGRPLVDLPDTFEGEEEGQQEDESAHLHVVVISTPSSRHFAHHHWAMCASQLRTRVVNIASQLVTEGRGGRGSVSSSFFSPLLPVELQHSKQKQVSNFIIV